MGFWDKVIANSSGSPESIICKTCGTTYRGTIDKRFPYATCGSCLEKADYNAKKDGDNEMSNMIQWEFKRRANQW